MFDYAKAKTLVPGPEVQAEALVLDAPFAELQAALAKALGSFDPKAKGRPKGGRGPEKPARSAAAAAVQP